jgi:hypothetical protein
MKADTSRQWKEFLSGYHRVHFYTVDPGAHALAVELVPLVDQLGRLSGWYAEGWSAAHNRVSLSANRLESELAIGDTLFLGSQTNFERTKGLLRRSLAAGVVTVFLFDHWKNYAEHFAGGALPDIVVVSDEIARRQFLAAVGEHAAARVRVLPHPGIDAAAQRVSACNIAVQPDMVALLLDPTEFSDGLGYDWRSTLEAAIAVAAVQPGTRLLVKPHPRQNIRAVEAAIQGIRNGGYPAQVYEGETERLIAAAREVWGMTTTALNIALASGKPIRSFQIGRNEAGARMSNPHIEPFAVVSMEEPAAGGS